MYKRTVIQHAAHYLTQLSQGVDPIGGGCVGEDSLLSQPRLEKCFAYVSELLTALLENEGYVPLEPDAAHPPRFEVVRKKTAFHLEDAQKRRVYISQTPITPLSFVNQINRQIDGESMEKLSVKPINSWLERRGYICQTKQAATIQRTVWKPAARASEIGIAENEAVDPLTGEVKTRLTLSPQAQNLILRELESILEEPGEK